VGTNRPGDAVARVSLPPATTSSRSARRFVLDALARWGRSDLADTAAVVVSELVTNAVVHARTTCRVTLRLTADAVRIEVGDDGPGAPELREPSPSRPGGRGLRLVATLSRAWGSVVATDGRGKVVWAELGG
jgi:anti-sigma regulatory factor (Ser/Thr protein kinase)